MHKNQQALRNCGEKMLRKRHWIEKNALLNLGENKNRAATLMFVPLNVD